VLIDKSPFAASATCRPEGRDCLSRGDLPDRRGNNRACSLRNIVRDSRTALFLFQSDSTLRLNGRAQISIDPGLLTSLRTDGKARREYHAKPRTR
jgi:predicted pyridoxine 5'-phosphate oxidase superfamily flavin-nucleotide-binding protein